MRRLATLAFVICVHPAIAAETVRVIGGKLGPTGPEAVFTAKRDNILVAGLPIGWSAGAGQCHTVVPAQYPALSFRFEDGNTSTKALEATGYTLSTGQYGLPGTSLTVCRNAAGKVASAAAQVAMVGHSGNMLALYVVTAVNTSRMAGSSSSTFEVTNFQQAQAFTASASVVNGVIVTH